jgi:MoxR-like ATPase
MEERQITVAGTTHALPDLFIVLATQNPIEQEGTYPLPEAQLDRFLLQVNVDYPDPAAEKRMMIETTGVGGETVSPVMNAGQLIAAQTLVRRIPVGERVVDAILALVRAGRPASGASGDMAELIAWGPGPRASQALMLTVRARALLQGRLSPSVEDVVALAPPVLRHRMALTFTARAEGVTLDRVIERLCATIAA